MGNLIKASELKGFSIAQLRQVSVNSKTDLLAGAIGDAIGKKIKKYSSVISISHYYELKAVINNKTAKVLLLPKESPGLELQYREEPKELHFFSYEQLKKDADYSHGIYRGKLHGTIQLCSCPKDIACPSCSASGVCHACNGEKQIECPVCKGDKICVACGGSGQYPCGNCKGSGNCPDCDNGWCFCNTCYGNGEVSCEDCDGSGNYIDETCNRCGGSGRNRNGKHCNACNGTGQYVQECRNCDGSGLVECDNCDGEGGWTCEKCNGSGQCSRCYGSGHVKCRACRGSGTCGKCVGKGKIWCPDCQGKGICFDCKGSTRIKCPRCNGTGHYQNYIEYTFEEKESSNLFCSLLIENNHIKDIIGDICYEGVIYDFFARKANVYNADDVIKTLSGLHRDLFKQWIAIENYSTFSKDTVNDDYLNTHIQLMKIPVTKVLFNCNSSNFNIYIVGNNQIVFYDKLPGLKDSLVGRFKKLFH